jgi:hypothetical protein
MSRQILNAIAAAAAALGSIGFAADKPVASKKYQAYLSPMPHNDAMHTNFRGKGDAIATLTGDTMSLSGTFTGLAGAATKARICLSVAAGIPGKTIFEFAVPSGVEGKAAGTFKLDKDQTAALQKGQLYIQIDSEKAPNGNLWGWLLPEHEVVGQDVPQKGPWFLPEFSVKTK